MIKRHTVLTRVIFFFFIACLSLVGVKEMKKNDQSAQAALQRQENAPLLTTTLFPGQSTEISSPDGSIRLSFPAGAVEIPVDIALYSLAEPLNTTGWRGAAVLSFLATAYDGDGNPVNSFKEPASLTIHYSEDALDGINESILKVYLWQEIPPLYNDASSFCSPASVYQHDLSTNQISLDVCSMGEFVLMQDKPVPSLAYLSLIAHQTGTSYNLSGKVSVEDGTPIEFVKVSAAEVYSTQTNDQGEFILPNLPSGVYQLEMEKHGYMFPQNGQQVSLPGNQQEIEIIGMPVDDCYEEIINGGFEKNTGWYIHGSTYPAGYSTARKYSGLRSMRAGIINTYDNRFSYSVFSQDVVLPSNTTSATLTFWLFPRTTESLTAPLPPAPRGATMPEEPMAGDVNYVFLTDTNNNILATLVWERLNVNRWVGYTFNLVGFEGRQLRLKFGSYNDGAGGVTGMYVDDVSLNVCTGLAITATPTNTPTVTSTRTETPTPTSTSTPTPTPTATNTPTSTPTRTPTPTATATPTPTSTSTVTNTPTTTLTPTITQTRTPTVTPTTACGWNLMYNWRFEDTTGWEISGSSYPASYTTERAYSGLRSMKTGVTNTAFNYYSISAFQQDTVLPLGADYITVNFWAWTRTTENPNMAIPAIPRTSKIEDIYGPDAGDIQYVLLENRTTGYYSYIFWQRWDDRFWQNINIQIPLDALTFAPGDTVRLKFGTRNDGVGGITAMYVDDAKLEFCDLP